MKKLLYPLGLMDLGTLSIVPKPQVCSASTRGATAVPSDIVLAQAFAIPEMLPQPKNPCSIVMTVKSRQFLREALEQADQIEHPLDKAGAVLALARSYKRFEVPSTLNLLAYAEGLSQRIVDLATKIRMLKQLGQAHNDFERSLETNTVSDIPRLMREGPLMSENSARLMDEAAELALSLGDRSQATDQAIADLANWYSNIEQPEQANALAATIRNREIRELTVLTVTSHADQHGSMAKEDIPDRHTSDWKQAQRFQQELVALETSVLQAQELVKTDFEPALTQIKTLDVPGERYIFGLSLARLMVQAQRYDLALNYLAEDILADYKQSASVGYVEEQFDLDFSRFMPAQVAGEVALRGYPAEAIAFVNCLPEGTDKTINQAIAHAAVANTYFSEQEHAQAKTHLDQAQSYASQLLDSTEKGWVLVTMGAGVLAQGDRPWAEALLAEAIALDPKLEACAQSFQDSAEMLAKEGGSEEAQVMEQISTLLNLQATPTSAQLRQVKEYLAQLTHPENQLEVLRQLAVFWDIAGDAEVSLQYLTRAINLVQTDPEFEAYRVATLENLFYDFAALGGSWFVQQRGAGLVADASIRQSLMMMGLENQVHRTYRETLATSELEALTRAVQSLPASSEQREMLIQMVVAWSEQGEMAQARRLMVGLEGGDRVLALTQLAEAVAIPHP